MKKIILILSLIIILSPLILAYIDKEVSNCDIDLSSCQIKNIELNQSILNLTQERDFYKNLSKYYEELYLSKNINLTNREIIYLRQDINNFYTEIENIKSELSLIRLSLKISIPIISITLVSLLGLAVYLKKKIRQGNSRED